MRKEGELENFVEGTRASGRNFLLLELLSHTADQDTLSAKRELSMSRYCESAPLFESLVCSQKSHIVNFVMNFVIVNCAVVEME